MVPFLKSFALLALTAFLASCGAPSGGSSAGRDYWGHRPGPKGFKTVIIDAGHGGKDPGAVSRHTGQREKDLTLDMARRIRGELGGFRTILMRSSDEFVDLDDRVARANRHGGAILVSMHFNSGPSGIRGPETYYWLEGGYLSNSAEARLIQSSAYRDKLAKAIAGAIKTQSAIGDSGTGPLPPPINAPMSRPTDSKE